MFLILVRPSRGPRGSVLTLSSGPYWRLIVEAVGPTWSEHVVGAGRARTVTLTAADGILVTATPWADRMAAGWSLTLAVVDLVATDPPAFDQVPATIVLPGLAIEVPADVLAGVLAGRGRRWWAKRVAVRLGGPQVSPPPS